MAWTVVSIRMAICQAAGSSISSATLERQGAPRSTATSDRHGNAWLARRASAFDAARAARSPPARSPRPLLQLASRLSGVHPPAAFQPPATQDAPAPADANSSRPAGASYPIQPGPSPMTMPIGGALGTGVGALSAIPTPTPEQMTERLNNPPMAADKLGASTPFPKLLGCLGQPRSRRSAADANRSRHTAPASPRGAPTLTALRSPPPLQSPPLQRSAASGQSAAVRPWPDPRRDAAAHAGPARRRPEPWLWRAARRRSSQAPFTHPRCSPPSIGPTPIRPAGQAVLASLRRNISIRRASLAARRRWARSTSQACSIIQPWRRPPLRIRWCRPQRAPPCKARSRPWRRPLERR